MTSDYKELFPTSEEKETIALDHSEVGGNVDLLATVNLGVNVKSVKSVESGKSVSEPNQ